MWTAIFLNGDDASIEGMKFLVGAAGRIIAADGGLNWARQCGARTELWLGDHDSLDAVSAEILEKDKSIRRQSYPRDKNDTDSALALEEALRDSAPVSSHTLRDAADGGAEMPPFPESMWRNFLPARQGIMLLSAFGRRQDHVLSNINLAMAHCRADLPILLSDGRSLLWCLRAPFSMSLRWLPVQEEGKAYFSLIPTAEGARGLDLHEAVWPLEGASLLFGQSRGISNLPLEGKSPRFAFREGSLFLLLGRE